MTSEASRRLDAHLARSIELFKREEKPVNKLKELSERMRALRATMDAEADDLLARADALEGKFKSAVDGHRRHMDRAREGVAEMEDAVRDFEGANNPPEGEESTGSSGAFPAGG